MVERRPWHDRPCNAFGRPLVPILEMSGATRILQLRRAVGRLLADEDPASRWLGAALQQWLESGWSLETELGLSPPRGSKSTVAGKARQAMKDRALVRFANEVGCDVRALEILRGERECPPELESLLTEVVSLNVARGPHAVTRARRRLIGKRR